MKMDLNAHLHRSDQLAYAMVVVIGGWVAAGGYRSAPSWPLARPLRRAEFFNFFSRHGHVCVFDGAAVWNYLNGLLCGISCRSARDDAYGRRAT